MAGIDNITKEILQEAQERAAALIAEAQKKADDAQAEAKQAAEETLKKAGEKADQDAANYGERIKSQIGLRKRQAALVAKQDIIDQVIGAAQKKLASQDAAPYFEMTSNGSIPLPSDFDIFLPRLSLISPWIITVWKGHFPVCS